MPDADRPSRAADDPVPVEDWPPARGPHLPDALGVLPGPAWIFVLLAITRLAWAVRETSFGPVPDPWRVGQLVLFEIPAVTTILLPAALLARHPDARSRGPTLFLGVAILAVVAWLRVLDGPLGSLFEQLTPGSQETPFLVPLDLVYGMVVGILSLYAVASIGLGLSQARTYADRSGTSLIVGVVALLVVLSAIARIVLLAQNPIAESVTLIVIFSYASTGGLGVLSLVAYGYLAATLARGARAGEKPSAGWRIAGAGALLVMVGFAFGTVIIFARPTPESQALFTNLGLLINGISALGCLGLLGGFALGMPSPDDLDDRDPENETENETENEPEAD